MPLRPINQMRQVVQEWQTSSTENISHTVLDLMDLLLDKIEQIKINMPEMKTCRLVYENPPKFTHLSIFLRCDCNPNSTNFLVFTLQPNKKKDLWLDATVPQNHNYSHLNVLNQKINKKAKTVHRLLIKIDDQRLKNNNPLIENHMKLAFQHTKSAICDVVA